MEDSRDRRPVSHALPDPQNGLDVQTGLDLQTVRIVRALADTGTVTAAAALLGYSQPAVSQHLRRAERRLGQPLVVRQGRGVRLTEAGLLVARHAVTIGAALEAAAGDLAELAGGRAGTVRMAAFPSASATVLPRFLAAMAQDHPGIKVTYVEAEPPESAQLLAAGAVDLAVTFDYASPDAAARPDDAVGRVRLLTEPMTLVLPAGHPVAGRSAPTLAALAADRWVAGCPLCRDHLMAECRRAGFTPTVDYETDNPAAVVSLVAAGLGVAVLPGLALATTVVPSSVALRPLGPPVAHRRVDVTYARPSRHVPAVAAALAVVGRLAREGAGD